MFTVCVCVVTKPLSWAVYGSPWTSSRPNRWFNSLIGCIIRVCLGSLKTTQVAAISMARPFQKPLDWPQQFGLSAKTWFNLRPPGHTHGARRLTLGSGTCGGWDHNQRQMRSMFRRIYRSSVTPKSRIHPANPEPPPMWQRRRSDCTPSNVVRFASSRPFP